MQNKQVLDKELQDFINNFSYSDYDDDDEMIPQNNSFKADLILNNEKNVNNQQNFEMAQNNQMNSKQNIQNTNQLISQNDLTKQQQNTSQVQNQFTNHFIGNKAGMKNIDKDKIKQIIQETTKNSKLYKFQQQKQIRYNDKINQMKQELNIQQKDKRKLQNTQKECENLIVEYESQLILNRVWIHFDMDMFYAACEILEKPDLKDKPVAVGGIGMISTANYIARQYGVRSAMPGFIAIKLCPELIFIDPNFELYRQKSKLFKDVLAKYDHNYEGIGLDECNLDITNYLQEKNINSQQEIFNLATQIRKQVYDQTGGLTCSCGIGQNKMIAKLCSEVNKPNGQYMLIGDHDDIKKFMFKQDIRKIPGIGNVNEMFLRALDINSCEDLIKQQVNLRLCFSQNSFEFLIKSALGIDRCFHIEQVDQKSIMASRTFQIIEDVNDMINKLEELAQMVSQDIKFQQKISRHLMIVIKTHKFESKTKSIQLEKYISEPDEIFKCAVQVFNQMLPLEPLRLIGIQLSDMIKESEFQQNSIENFFKKIEQKQKNSETTRDNLKENQILDDEKDNQNIIEEEKQIQDAQWSLNDSEPQVPKSFVCFICGKSIDTAGNNQRMNKHIDLCLKNQNEQQSNQKTMFDIQNIDEPKKKKSVKSIQNNNITKFFKK